MSIKRGPWHEGETCDHLKPIKIASDHQVLFLKKECNIFYETISYAH